MVLFAKKLYTFHNRLTFSAVSIAKRRKKVKGELKVEKLKTVKVVEKGRLEP